MDVRLPIVVGTRGSPLAIAQTRYVCARLVAAHPALAEDGALVTETITTSGDRFTDRPLAEIGGKGLFTKEIEEALLDERIDLAVHSMKDVPTWLPEGLEIAAIPEREDPRDVLIARAGLGPAGLADLPAGRAGRDRIAPPPGADSGAPPRCRDRPDAGQRGHPAA